MNLDLLEKDKDSLLYSDIYTNVQRSIDNTYLSSDMFNSSDKVRGLLFKWYMKGYLKALDDYKKLAK